MTSTRRAAPLVNIKNSNKTKDVPKAGVPAGNPWYLEVPESNVVVAVDPGSIPCKCSPASTRYAPAEGCGKVLTPTPSPSPSAIFRIFLFLSFTPEQGRFTGMATSNKLRVARDEKHNIAER